MTYLKIKQLVTFFIHRADLDPYMDDFFAMARELISQKVRLQVMEQSLTDTVSNGVLAMPADFIEARSVLVATPRGLKPLRLYTRATLEALAGSAPGQPVGYTLEGSNMLIKPSAGDVELTMIYYAKPTALVNDTDTNALLDTYQALYLFGALIYAANAVQDTESEENYRNHFANELTNAQISNEAGRWSGDALKMGRT